MRGDVAFPVKVWSLDFAYRRASQVSGSVQNMNPSIPYLGCGSSTCEHAMLVQPEQIQDRESPTRQATLPVAAV